MTNPVCTRCGEEWRPAKMSLLARIRLALMMLFAVHETCGCDSQRFSYGEVTTTDKEGEDGK